VLAAPGEAVKEIRNDVQEFKDRTLRKLAGVRCPHHQRSPRLRFHGATLRDVSIQMSGCCEKLIEMANRAIAER
jgi:hypothetical protein